MRVGSYAFTYFSHLLKYHAYELENKAFQLIQILFIPKDSTVSNHALLNWRKLIKVTECLFSENLINVGLHCY